MNYSSRGWVRLRDIRSDRAATGGRTMRRNDQVRLDKWLWAARFFKTRGLAQAAISGGRVHLNGQRVKPSHGVKAGDELSVSKGPYRFDLTVVARPGGGAPRHGGHALRGAAEAGAARDALREERRLQRSITAGPERRPDKRAPRRSCVSPGAARAEHDATATPLLAADVVIEPAAAESPLRGADPARNPPPGLGTTRRFRGRRRDCRSGGGARSQGGNRSGCAPAANCWACIPIRTGILAVTP